MTTPSQTLPEYQVYALRYATNVDRRRSENFIARDPHDESMPMDYFVWVLRDATRTILVDTGFNESAARDRGRELLRCPIESLAVLGIQPDEVSDVVLTHLHYDHAGNIDKLPNALFHVQEAEMHYACGRHMCRGVFRAAYNVEDVATLLRRVYAERVNFCAPRHTLAPGVELVMIGGHTQGLQSVRVHTRRGWIVLASDASHYYENMMRQSPFPIVFHVGDMLNGFDTLRALADSPDHIIPGHDPQVRQRYPFYQDPALDVVSLHEVPQPWA